MKMKKFIQYDIFYGYYRSFIAILSMKHLVFQGNIALLLLLAALSDTKQ